MASQSTKNRWAEYLMYPADALVFAVASGAILIGLKTLTAVPAPWTDSLNAFHITMTLATVVGAAISWVLHRRHTGARGLIPAAIGVAILIVGVYAVQFVVNDMAAASPDIAPLFGTITQSVGLIGLLTLFVAGVVHLLRPSEPGFDAIGFSRLASLVIVAGFIAFRFLPETRADAVAAPFYAIMGFATTQGTLGVMLGDALGLAWDRVTGRHSPALPTADESA